MTPAAMTVLVTTATIEESRLVVAILEEAGIPAVLEGENLYDEWAVSQRAMGLLATEVKVPTSALDSAQRVLREAHRQGLALREAPPDLELEPTDEALTPSDAESAELAHKLTYHPVAILFACVATGALVWILLFLFKKLPGQ